METSSQLTNESLDAVRIIEAKQRFCIKQIKNCAVLETLYPKYQDRTLTKEQIEQKIIRLAKIDNSIKPVKFEFVIGNWFSFRKNLMKRWIDLEQEKQVLKRIQNKSTVLKENFEDMLEYCSLESEIYKFDEIVNRKIESDNPIFESDDKVSLNSFEDDNSLVDPLEFELARQQRIKQLVNNSVSGIGNNVTNNTTNNITIHNHFSASRESLESMFAEGNARITAAEKLEIKRLCGQQKRREKNIEFLIKNVREYQLDLNKGEDQLRKAYKANTSIREKKNLIKVFSKMKINNQIRALLGEWVCKEEDILYIRIGFVSTDLMRHRYRKVFTKILGNEINLYPVIDIYVETKSGRATSRSGTFEQVNAKAFKSIPNFKCFDENPFPNLEFREADVEEDSVSVESTSIQRNDDEVDHLRDLNLYDEPKPSSRLEKIRIRMREGKCVIS